VAGFVGQSLRETGEGQWLQNSEHLSAASYGEVPLVSFEHPATLIELAHQVLDSNDTTELPARVSDTTAAIRPALDFHCARIWPDRSRSAIRQWHTAEREWRTQQMFISALAKGLEGPPFAADKFVEAFQLGRSQLYASLLSPVIHDALLVELQALTELRGDSIVPDFVDLLEESSVSPVTAALILNGVASKSTEAYVQRRFTEPLATDTSELVAFLREIGEQPATELVLEYRCFASILFIEQPANRMIASLIKGVQGQRRYTTENVGFMPEHQLAKKLGRSSLTSGRDALTRATSGTAPSKSTNYGECYLETADWGTPALPVAEQS
jgi:hypothetical protein